MEICLRSFVVVADAGEHADGHQRLTCEFAIRLDAEAALSALRERYPQAQVQALETRYDLTKGPDLHRYQAHVGRLYATCATSGVWDEPEQPERTQPAVGGLNL